MTDDYQHSQAEHHRRLLENLKHAAANALPVAMSPKSNYSADSPSVDVSHRPSPHPTSGQSSTGSNGSASHSYPGFSSSYSSATSSLLRSPVNPMATPSFSYPSNDAFSVPYRLQTDAYGLGSTPTLLASSSLQDSPINTVDTPYQPPPALGDVSFGGYSGMPPLPTASSAWDNQLGLRDTFPLDAYGLAPEMCAPSQWSNVAPSAIQPALASGINPDWFRPDPAGLASPPLRALSPAKGHARSMSDTALDAKSPASSASSFDLGDAYALAADGPRRRTLDEAAKAVSRVAGHKRRATWASGPGAHDDDADDDDDEDGLDELPLGHEVVELGPNGKPKRTERRRMQNRLAQRAFRARKKVHQHEVAIQMQHQNQTIDAQSGQIKHLTELVDRLQRELISVKAQHWQKHVGDIQAHAASTLHAAQLHTASSSMPHDCDECRQDQI
ncbi:hypothetical protein Q5752_003547 [Cryptotrichosporon argae]